MYVPKVGIFVDGPYLSALARHVGLNGVDFKALKLLLAGDDILQFAYYVTPVYPEDEQLNLRPILDAVRFKGGFRPMEIPGMIRRNSMDQAQRVPVNTAVHLAVCAMEHSSHVQRMVFVVGDKAYACLFDALKRRGVHIELLGTYDASSILADELRRGCDDIIEIKDYASQLNREPAVRRFK